MEILFVMNPLNEFLRNTPPEEQAEATALAAYLQVLKHKKILEGVDLDRLAYIAENGKSETHRHRASQLLSGARQRAAEALAHATGVREEILDEKGLSPK